MPHSWRKSATSVCDMLSQGTMRTIWARRSYSTMRAKSKKQCFEPNTYFCILYFVGMLLLFLWFSLIIELYRRIAINETLSYEHCEDDLQAYE